MEHDTEPTKETATSPNGTWHRANQGKWRSPTSQTIGQMIHRWFVSQNRIGTLCFQFYCFQFCCFPNSVASNTVAEWRPFCYLPSPISTSRSTQKLQFETQQGEVTQEPCQTRRPLLAAAFPYRRTWQSPDRTPLPSGGPIKERP